MNKPDIAVVLQGNTSYLREIQAMLQKAGMKTFTGPLPGTS